MGCIVSKLFLDFFFFIFTRPLSVCHLSTIINNLKFKTKNELIFNYVIPLPHQTSLSVATDCNRLQPIGMLGVSPNFGANGSNTSNTSVLLASRRENPYRL